MRAHDLDPFDLTHSSDCWCFGVMLQMGDLLDEFANGMHAEFCISDDWRTCGHPSHSDWNRLAEAIGWEMAGFDQEGERIELGSPTK